MKKNRNFEIKYRPKYHFSAPKGWINDPNGLCFFKGRYHLFYQYSPHDTKQGDMHWGHATSSDLIKWDHQPIALFPDASYDSEGCWSGSAIVKNGKLHLLYTGVSKREDGSLRQTQNLAISTDGITFTKWKDNPVIVNDDISKWTSPIDFRDPYIIKSGNSYHVLIGTHNDKEAILVSYKSDDLITYRFYQVIARSERHGTMFECPTYFRANKRNVLILSPQNKPVENDSYWNISSSIYALVKDDFLDKGTQLDHVFEIDHGLDFYAPQTLTHGRQPILIAWMYMWGRRYYLDDINAGWIHNLTLPRKLIVRNDRLIQMPISQLSKYYCNPINLTTIVKGAKSIDGISGNVINLKITFLVVDDLQISIRLLKKQDNYGELRYDATKSELKISRTNSGVPLNGLDREKSHKGYRTAHVNPINGYITLDIYLDVITIEVFVNGGETSMSMISFSGGDQIEFDSNIEAMVIVEKNDIIT
jgi:beta-fructofuranosidase